MHAAAVRTDPQAGDGAGLDLAQLMRLAFDGVPLTPIAQRLIARAESEVQDADALMSLSVVLQLHGLKAEGLAVQTVALKSRTLFHRPAARAPALRLLALMAPGDLMTNTPLEFLVEDADVALARLYLMPDRPLPAALPAHDVLFVAVSESDLTRELLERIDAALPAWGGTPINLPARIVKTSRSLAQLCLEGAPGIAMPASLRVTRAELEQLGQGGPERPSPWPLAPLPWIVRPVDSHAGHGLEKLDGLGGLVAYLAQTPAEAFFVASFVDYRGGDGLYRKFRVVLIDGQAFPAHMAISSHWMIHYLNAGMTESAAKRAEEQAFMDGFEAGFGRRHARALQAIAERFGLDYLVIDCAETADGRLLVFEIDPGAVVHSMDPPALFPYKRAHMQRLFAAFRRLLAERAAPRLQLPAGGLHQG